VSFLIIMVLMLGVMYVLMIRPQRQRQAQQQSMIDGAGVGDDVLTTGGIYGTISEVEGDDIVVEIAQDVTVHMTRRGIAAVLPPEDEDDEEVEELETEDAEEQDEPGVTDDEEAVSAVAGDASAADERR
jgi:preprotein translocase subunit YajC